MRSHPFQSIGGRRHASGFSMIEVLITLVVLALGLLGFALLQTMNLRYTQSANYRTQATNLAYDLLDQMRANRLTAAQYTAASFLPNAVTPEKCSRPVATVTIAANVKRWQCQVVDAFGPETTVVVTYAGGVARVSITWGERIATSPNSTFAMETRL